MVDHQGSVVDGDQILFIIARHLLDQGRLQGGVVGTLMSNLGLELSLKELDVPFAEPMWVTVTWSQKWFLGIGVWVANQAGTSCVVMRPEPEMELSLRFRWCQPCERRVNPWPRWLG